MPQRRDSILHTLPALVLTLFFRPIMSIGYLYFLNSVVLVSFGAWGKEWWIHLRALPIFELGRSLNQCQPE